MMLGLDPRKAVFSLNTFIACLLALWIGFSIGLPRPYWAMLTAYITAQPLSGAVRSKAVYRVLGTVLGGAAAVALVPHLVNSPVLLVAALCLWVGFCLYISLLDRTPRAYVFLLGGYTAAIIGFPSVNAPGAIFDTALARVEEITLGILCTALTHSVFFPRSVARDLLARIDGFLADASRWMRGALDGRPSREADRDRRRLAADATELRLLATHLPFDTENLQAVTRAVHAMQDRMAVLLPLATAVEDRLEALSGLGDPLEAALRNLVAEVQAFAEAGDDAAYDQAAADREADRLIAACKALRPGIDAAAEWPTLLKVSLLRRLAELIRALQDSRDLRCYVSDPSQPVPAHLSAEVRARARRPLYHDHGLALLSALAAMVAIGGCCALWISTGWLDGAIAAMMAAVFCSFFASQDDPAPAIANFLIFIVLSLPLAALYLFAILPAIDGFILLAVALAPTLLALGYMQGDARRTAVAMPLLIGFAGSLSLQETFSADFAEFANASLGQLVGIAAALIFTRLVRSVGAEWTAWRILRSGWRRLARLAAAPTAPDRIALTSLLLDRLGLLTPRLALAPANEALAAADALNDLRIGLNVIDLQQARRTVEAPARQAIAALLTALADHFRALARGRAAPVDPVLTPLDGAIAGLAASAPSAERTAGLVALAGLRRNLFPAAPAYRGPAPETLGAAP